MRPTPKNTMATTLLGLSLFFVAGQASAGLNQGDPLPSFEVTTTKGEAITEKNFDGRVPGVIYLYKTQKCNTCLEGLEKLKEVGGQFKNDLKIIAISKDETDGQDSTISMANGGSSFSAFSASILPTTVMVGPEGKIMKVLQGGGKPVEDMLNSLAESQLATHKPQNAQKIYLRASAGGQSVVAQAGVAYSQLKEGKTTDAEQSFKEMAGSGDKQLALQGKEGLAEVYLQQGKTDEAVKVANEALKIDNKRSMANLVKGKALHAQGKADEAEKALTMATADNATSDFAWQKSEANLAMGNLQNQGKKSKIALKSFRKAAQENPYSTEAISNEGVALKEAGEPEKALEIFKKLQNVDPTDKLAHALMRQAQEAIAQKADIEKQTYINGMVKDLVQQFKENKQAQAGKPSDDWTSPALSISILGFQNTTSGMLTGRIGLEGILQDELTRELQNVNIRVVERAIIDKLLAELKLGSSDLADPDTALRLGRIMAARLITTGSFFTQNNSNIVSMRLVDAETTNIVLSLSEKEKSAPDPVALAPKFAQAIAKMVAKDYPLKGRIADVDGDTVIINLGSKHGVKPGAKFNVVGEGKPIELNGRILGYKPANLGSLEVTEVMGDMIASAKVVDKSGTWEKSQKIIQKN